PPKNSGHNSSRRNERNRKPDNDPAAFATASSMTRRNPDRTVGIAFHWLSFSTSANFHRWGRPGSHPLISPVVTKLIASVVATSAPAQAEKAMQTNPRRRSPISQYTRARAAKTAARNTPI